MTWMEHMVYYDAYQWYRWFIKYCLTISAHMGTSQLPVKVIRSGCSISTPVGHWTIKDVHDISDGLDQLNTSTFGCGFEPVSEGSALQP